jgi:hypothetical protein
MTINNSKNDAVNPTTLTLTTPQRYFGSWWSAGDPKDVLSFYSGSTLVETFSTSDIVSFINAQGKRVGTTVIRTMVRITASPLLF